MTGRRVAREVARAAAVLAAVWLAALILTGGFDLRLGAWTLSSHQLLRPLLWGSVAVAAFVWANGASRTAETWSRAIARLPHGAAAGALALAAFAVGAAFSTTVANASDAYGYVSQADLWLSGRVRVEQPWARDAPWPGAAWTFAPLGYRPVEGDGATDLVPVYSPGLPWLMALAKGLGGQAALFLVVPLSGAVLVLATWGLGCRLGSSAAGLVAAWFVLTSPVLLFMQALPMTDVPVAAGWAVASWCALGSGTGSAAGAGLAAAIAIAIRPNLAWLAAFPAAWLGWRKPRSLVAYTAGVLVSVVTILIVYDRLYGSPWQSGYGDLSGWFAWAHLLPNLRAYTGWIVETQTPLVLLGAAALAWPRLWAPAQSHRSIGLAALLVAALWVYYSFYLQFDAWWFLRFMLSAWPWLMIGLAAALLTIARGRPAGTVIVTWLVVVLGLYTVDLARARGAFALWRSDRAYVAAARETRAITPDRTVVLADLHSGSLRYYGGRVTLRFTLLERDWLDRAVEWMAGRGAEVYALLEPGEVDALRARFAGQSVVTRLDLPPVFRWTESGLALYPLAAPPAARTAELAVSATALRAAPPVAMAPFTFR